MEEEGDSEPILAASSQVLSRTTRKVGFFVLSLSLVAVLIIIVGFLSGGGGKSHNNTWPAAPSMNNGGMTWEGPDPPITSAYRRSTLSQLSLSDVWKHLQALQTVADESGGTRAVGSPGFNATVAYVASQLSHLVGNFLSSVVIQPYNVLSSVTNNASLAVGNEGSTMMSPLTFGSDFNVLSYSGAGVINDAPVIVVSNQGCDLTDFPSSMTASVAVIMRGTCTFRSKAVNAVQRGAVGVVIVNTDDVSFLGTLGSDTPLIDVPVIGVRNGVKSSFEIAAAVVSIVTDVTIRNAESANVIATSNHGNPNNTVVFGSHLDSVLAGPGMNDDASGTSVNLALLLAMAESEAEISEGIRKAIYPTNRLIFGFWGGEELGLTGSKHYVSQLSAAETSQHAVNFNMDMLGSPNFERGVFDATDGGDYPLGCAAMSVLIMESYRVRNLSYLTSAFDGRSDYGSFVAGGIAAGGIFTGAEKIKSMNGRTMFGGIANAAYDTCYHQACDTLDNVNTDVLMQETHVAAGVMEFLADDLDLRAWLSTNVTAPPHRRRTQTNTWMPKRVGSEYVS